MNLDLRDIPVVYINMDKDVDKRKRIENHIDQLGFKTKIRVPGVVHQDGARAGCALAQYNALHEIDPPFIILEDDATPFDYNPIISIPDDTDALYLGISSWGRMNSHSGPCVQYEDLNGGLLRIYNMLSAHSVLYLDEEYVSLCSKIAHQSFDTAQHQDIGFAEIQRYYNVYAFDDPLFYQTSSNGTDESLTSYPTIEVIQPDRNFWKPTVLY